MLAVTIVAVGKLKEKYLGAAMTEYSKRLSAYARFAVVELPESRLPSQPSEAEIAKALTQEGKQILAKIPPRAQCIALCVEGEMMSSPQLAAKLETMSTKASHLVFVIGSSHGLAPEVKSASQLRLSLSPMTFPHQLTRVLLTEQIYRGLSINSGSKYHK